ncbi:MAG: exodeoxyribonuclease VII small subunit [Acidimicrobiales bacterium]
MTTPKGEKDAARNAETTGTPVGEMSYTEASRELDEIVEFFEQREVDVDLLVGRLERATAIVDELDKRLRATRAQVEELVPRLEEALGARAGAGEETGEETGEESDASPSETDGAVTSQGMF